MPKFIIRGSRRTLTQQVVEFDVVFLRSSLSAGDQFIVYDTHHPLTCNVLEVMPQGEMTVLRCEMQGKLGWENQFAEAIVDTEAKQRPESFGYLHLGKDFPEK